MAHYTRNRKIITNTGEQLVHKYVNEAKRASCKLQAAGNTLSVVK